MKFCSECASPVALSIPEGDNRPRFVCTQCATVHETHSELAKHQDLFHGAGSER